MAKEVEGSSGIPTCDAYFEAIQSRKRLPSSLQESLTAAFAQIPVSSFPGVPCGKVIEIPSDASILDAVQILSRNNILAAPVRNAEVRSVVEMYRWAPFLPVAVDSFMLTVLLLLSKYRLRNVPVIDVEKFYIKNFITQSVVVRGLKQCKGRDWFDCIAARPLSDLGLPFMSYDEVISIQSDELILEAFKRMKDNRIGGLPAVENLNRKIVGSVSIHDIRFLLLKPVLFSGLRELTVMNFIKAIETISSDSGTQPPTCSPDACLGSVIDRLASRNVH